MTKSVDAAQDALKDLRGEMSKSSSSVLKNLDKHLKDARKDLRGTSKAVVKDLEGLQAKLPGASRSGAEKSTGAKKSTSTARKTSTRSTTARKSSSTRSRSTASRPRARAKKS